MLATEVQGPAKARYLKSYQVRRAYQAAVQYPPAVPGVQDAIDIHCHCEQGQQDALAVAKHASANGMRGILYKTLVGRDDPMGALRKVEDELQRWADAEGVTPIKCWVGWNVAARGAPPSAAATRAQLDAGVTGIWLPVAMHANTLSKVGGRNIWWDATADRKDHTPPLPWDEALRIGHYLIDERGALKPEVREIVRLVAEYDRALFFGHATHAEIFALAEEVERLGYRRAVIDHPFSPFVDLNVAQMQQLARAGIWLNFTYDEISPLLGVDPKDMYEAIRAVGPEHCTLSSDAGEPLFPNSVECMRMMRGYMQAFGLSDEEVRLVSTTNPAFIVHDD